MINNIYKGVLFRIDDIHTIYFLDDRPKYNHLRVYALRCILEKWMINGIYKVVLFRLFKLHFFKIKKSLIVINP